MGGPPSGGPPMGGPPPSSGPPSSSGPPPSRPKGPGPPLNPDGSPMTMAEQLAANVERMAAKKAKREIAS